MSGARVLCVGILVADVFVPPLQRLPDAGELLVSDEFLLQPGGCTANVAVALGRLGIRARVCGRVGNDAFGDSVARDLETLGIETSAVLRTEGVGTAQTLILPVVGEDRRYIHSFGANACLTVSDIPFSDLSAGDVVYLGGYLLLPGLAEHELLAAFADARSRGVTIMLDVAPPTGASAPRPSIGALLGEVDYFVPNVDEARVLTGESDPRRQADALMSQGARRVLIKLGERGVYVRDGDDVFEMAAPEIEVVEPSGAGDAFAAGVILGIVEGWGLEDAVRFASAVGASACTALGCSAGLFTRPEAEGFVKNITLVARSGTEV